MNLAIFKLTGQSNEREKAKQQHMYWYSVSVISPFHMHANILTVYSDCE